MPQIRTYQQQTALSGTGDQPYMQPLPADSAVIGQSLQQAGGAMQNTAGLLNDIDIRQKALAQKQANETAEVWTAKAMSNAKLQWVDKLTQLQNTPDDQIHNLSANTLKEFDTFANDQINAAPTEQSKKLLQAQLLNMRTSIGTSAIDLQDKLQTSYNVNQLQQTITNNVAIAAKDPSQASTVYYNTNKAIDAMNIPEQQKYALKENMRNQMSSAYASNQILTNPVGFRNQLNPSVGQFPEGTDEAKIASVAESKGVDPLAAVLVKRMESGRLSTAGKSNVAESSAAGLYQQTNAAWQQYGSGDRNNPDDQVTGGVNQLSDIYNVLRGELGREPTINEAYTLYHLGNTGGSKLLHANNDAPISSVLSADAVKNNGYTGKTVGQVKDKINGRVNKELSSIDSQFTKAEAPFLQNIMTPQEKFQYIQQANQAAEQQQATYRVNLQQTIDNHEAQALNGIPPQQMLTPEQFNMMYPKDSARAMMEYAKYSNTMQTSYRISQFANQTPAEVNAIIQAATPAAGDENYAIKADLQQQMIKANAIKMEQVAKDPQQFVTTHDQLVQAAGQNYQNNPTPQNMQAYFSSSIAAQQRQGVQYPQLLSKSQENQLVAQLSQASGTQVSQTVDSLAQQYGSYWPMVYGQLATNPNTPSAMIVIPTIEDSNTKIELGNLANIKATDLAKNIDSGDAKLVDSEVADTLRTFGNSLDMSANNQKTIDAFNENVTKLAYTYVQQGFKPKQAAATAYQRVMGDQYTFVDNKASEIPMRIPVDQMPELVANGADEYVSRLSDANIFLLPAGSKGEDYIAYAQQIKTKPIWITNQDGTGLKLYTQGNNNTSVPVKYKDGKQVEVSFSDLRSLGNGEVVAAQQRADQQQQLQNLKVLRAQ